MVELVRMALDSVGCPDGLLSYGRLAIHWRKKLTPEELVGLDTAWLAIPAIDRGSAS
jgi:hypothetical protein